MLATFHVKRRRSLIPELAIVAAMVMTGPPLLSGAAAEHQVPRLDQQLDTELDLLAESNRLRATQPYQGRNRARMADQGNVSFTSFCSNDYLGLAGHPALADALAASAAVDGVGAGASRLVNGESPKHVALEAELAAFVGTQAALLFPTGYLTNLGVITALVGRGDLIVSDAANHASIIDGCRLSRAEVAIYPHLDAEAAAAALAASGPYRRRLLVTESLFSMDGDRAPLTLLADATQQTGAIMMVDEAHALGVSGPGGRGIAAGLGVKPDVVVGTLGKAFGTQGGFAAGSPALRRYLINRSRPFIYSTASPPPLVEATLAALTIVSGSEGETLRRRAHAVASRLRAALAAAGGANHGEDLILPYVIGDDAAAMALASDLRVQGYLVPAIRPPTVAAGTARLRITATAAHSDAEVDAFARALHSSRDRRQR